MSAKDLPLLYELILKRSSRSYDSLYPSPPSSTNDDVRQATLPRDPSYDRNPPAGRPGSLSHRCTHRRSVGSTRIGVSALSVHKTNTSLNII